MAQQVATNIHWHEGEVSRDERFAKLGHKGATVWFTGLSGSGKSTIAVALEQALMNSGVNAYRLDGDNIRMGLNKNLGFSAEDRAAVLEILRDTLPDLPDYWTAKTGG